MQVVDVEVISGVEGPCLSISDKHGGRRVAGPKPWGGGKVEYSFTVSVDELIKVIRSNAYTEGEKP